MWDKMPVIRIRIAYLWEAPGGEKSVSIFFLSHSYYKPCMEVLNTYLLN